MISFKHEFLLWQNSSQIGALGIVTYAWCFGGNRVFVITNSIVSSNLTFRLSSSEKMAFS